MTGRRQITTLFLCFGLAACGRSFTLPAAPGEASLRGTVVLVEAGTGQRIPIEGAWVGFVHTNLATQTNEDGVFTLGPIPDPDAVVSIRYDGNGDEVFERQRLVDLRLLSGGKQGDIEAGEIVLGENGFVRGRAVKGDLTDTTVGNAGINMFVPGTPYTTTTSDNGLYILRDIPDGVVDIAGQFPGYQAAGITQIRLLPGQVLDLKELVLELLPEDGPGEAEGTILRLDGGELTGIVCDLINPFAADPADEVITTATTDGEGAYVFSDVPPGVYHVRYSGSDIGTAWLYNIMTKANATVRLPSVGLSAGQDEPPQGGQTNRGVEPGNKPPVAKATDVLARTGELVTLDAAASADPDQDPLIFTWVQQIGTPVSLDINNSTLAKKAKFAAPAAGEVLAFDLTVTDPVGATDTTIVQVRVNEPPVALLPRSQVVAVDQSVTLDGSASYDPDATGALSYQWSCLTKDATSGDPLVTFDDATSETPTFTAPSTGGVLVELQLVVNDTLHDSEPDTILVYTSTSNIPPVADAGPDLELDYNETVLIQPGAGVFDPDGTISRYYWTPQTAEACGTVTGINGSGYTTDPNGLFTIVTPNAPCDVVWGLEVQDDGGDRSPVSLMTIRVRDRQPPKILKTEPVITTNAPAFGPVKVFLERPVQPDSLTGALRVTDASGNVLDGEVVFDAATLVIRYAPALPFPNGEAITVTVSGLLSLEGTPMDADYTFSFTAGSPFLRAPKIIAQNNAQYPQVASVGTDRFVFYDPTGNNPQIVRWNGAGNIADVQHSPDAGSVVATRQTDRKMQTFNGGVWMMRQDSSSSGTRPSPGAFHYTPNANGTSLSWGNVMYVVTDTPWNTYVDSYAATIDASGEFWAGFVSGATTMSAQYCSRCKDMWAGNYSATRPINGDVPDIAAPTATAAAGLVRHLAMTAWAGGVTLVWVENDGIGGPNSIAGSTYDPTGDTWIRLPGRNGDFILPAGAEGRVPTLIAGPNDTLLMAWQRTDGGMATIEVSSFDGTTWTDLGTGLNAQAPELERPALAVLGETVWVGWGAPAGTSSRPVVKGYDPVTSAWSTVPGTGTYGDIPGGAGCESDKPALAPSPEDSGMTVVVTDRCPTTSNSQVIGYDIK